jgi:hypothetical protein
MRRGLGALLVAAALSPADAAAEEYRLFQLGDGRSFAATILATEADGLRVRVPQGEMLVPFGLLQDMVPIQKSDYDAQPDWVVYLAAETPERRADLVAVFESVPHVSVVGEAGVRPLLSASQEAAAASCGVALDCLVAATAAAPWMWVVTARSEGPELVVEGAVNRGKTRNTLRLSQADRQRLAYAAYDVLEVVKVEPEPVIALIHDPPLPDVAQDIPRELSRQRIIGWSFVPLPGLPSLLQGDGGGFATACAIVAPATVLWVGAVGQNTQSRAQHLAFAAGGFYAATVAANQVFGLRSQDRAATVSVLPSSSGQGAFVGLTVQSK